MKNLITLIFGFLVTLNGFSQSVTNDFESGDRDIDIANCWAYNSVKIKSIQEVSNIINGTYSLRTNLLPSISDSIRVKSPWMQMGSGNVTFDCRVNQDDSSDDFMIDIFFIPFDENASDGEGTPHSISYSYTFTYPQSSVRTISYAIPSSIAGSSTPYRVYLTFYSSLSNNNRRIFIDDLSIPGNYYSDPSNSCMPLIPSYDSDGDGIDDDTDEFPSDPDKAYAINFQGDGNYATMAYEDLWPSKGDYDFNDLILDFNHKAYYNANNKITTLEGKAVVRAVGGVLINGFGIHFPGIAPTDIESVTGQELSTGIISNNTNGTETGQTYAVVILCDDLETVINRTTGSFFNTIEENPKGTSDTINYSIVFSNPITTSEYEKYSIFAFKDRDEEIHKTDKQPSDVVDVSLFGTLNDDSDPAASKYYQTENNLPWAIEIPEKFIYPKEKEDIIGAYNNLSNWAQSSGTSAQNWYTDEAGNRTSSKLYNK